MIVPLYNNKTQPLLFQCQHLISSLGSQLGGWFDEQNEEQQWISGDGTAERCGEISSLTPLFSILWPNIGYFQLLQAFSQHLINNTSLEDDSLHSRSNRNLEFAPSTLRIHGDASQLKHCWRHVFPISTSSFNKAIPGFSSFQQQLPTAQPQCFIFSMHSSMAIPHHVPI